VGLRFSVEVLVVANAVSVARANRGVASVIDALGTSGSKRSSPSVSGATLSADGGGCHRFG